MSDVLDDYREWQARCPDRVRTDYMHHVYLNECMIHMLAAEVERLRNGAPDARETVQPVLWAVRFDGEPLDPALVFGSASAAEDYQRCTTAPSRVVRLYRVAPPPTLTEAEREAGEPIAWGIQFWGGDLHHEVFGTKEQAEREFRGSPPGVCTSKVIPLYRSPTLTDAEREDLQRWIRECRGSSECYERDGVPELADEWRARACRMTALFARLGGGE